MTAPSDRILSIAALRALQARSDRQGTARLALHLGCLAGTGWLVAAASGWPVLPAVWALGLVQVALFAPAHETMHQTAFASRRANAIVQWLTSCPSLLNAQFYTAFHIAHHRHTQVPGEDPELATTGNPTTLGGYAWRVLSLRYWALRVRVIADCWRGDLRAYPYIAAQAAPRIVFSVRAMSVVMFGGAALSGVLLGWQVPLLYWIGPQLLGQPLLRAYLLAEHTGCTLDHNGLTNTRTTLTNAPIQFLMWNMPYHAEHHLYPSIPFFRLPDAHVALQARLGCVQHGYLRWNAGFIRQLMARTGRASSI